jgi:hypothetical protein
MKKSDWNLLRGYGIIDALLTMAVYEMLKNKEVCFMKNKVISHWDIISYYNNDVVKGYKYHFKVKGICLYIKLVKE